MDRLRVQKRMDRILAQAGKLKRKIEENPRNVRVDTWKMKLEGLEKSFETLRHTGREFSETPSDVGIKIDVPVGTFEIKRA